MRKLVFLSLAAFGLFLISSCQRANEKAMKEILQLEQELWSDSAGLIDQVKADALVRAYLDYPGKFPQDTAAPGFLLKAGELMMSLREPEQSVAAFQRLRDEYPAHPLVGDALFFQAFVTENDLKDMDQARTLYLEFLQDHPSHPLAEDARLCLQHLGKTPEQVIKEFQALQALEEPGTDLKE